MATSTVPAPTVTSTSTAPLAPAPKKPLWEKRLSDIFWINSVAMSNDGSRVVAATFIHDYRQRTGKFQPNVQSRFGTHLFDDAKNSPTAPKWSDEFDGSDGVFGVAISGDGKVAAASGWLEKTGNTPVGLLRAYDATDSKPDSIKVLLDYRDSNQRISWVALSDDGKVLTAVADDVYVFFRDGKAFNPVPVRLGVGGIANRYVTAVALHPSGTWLAACDASGHVHVARIANGAISTMITWTAPKEFPFLSVAIARDSQTFVVGGGNSVFHFAFDASGNLQAPIEYRHDSEPGPGDHSPRQAGWETSGECSLGCDFRRRHTIDSRGKPHRGDQVHRSARRAHARAESVEETLG